MVAEGRVNKGDSAILVDRPKREQTKGKRRRVYRPLRGKGVETGTKGVFSGGDVEGDKAGEKTG